MIPRSSIEQAGSLNREGTTLLQQRFFAAEVRPDYTCLPVAARENMKVGHEVSLGCPALFGAAMWKSAERPGYFGHQFSYRLR